MQRRARALAAAALIAGPTGLAFFSGGFFERPRLIAGLAVWGLAVVAALASPRPLPRTANGVAALVALALLTAWTALSYEWAPLGERAQADVQRMLLYLGVFAAAVALLRGQAARRALEPALAAGALGVVLYGLSERLLPGIVELDRSVSAEGRLEQPLTYWNAMGCLSAIGLVLCAHLAGDLARPTALRRAAAAGAAPFAVGTYLSFSRGALFALAGGLVLLILLAPERRTQARAVAIALTAGGVCAALASALPGVEALTPGEVGDTGEGALMLAALAVAAAAAAWVTGRLRPERRAPARERRLARPAVAVLAVVAVVGGVAAAAALETPSARPTGEATGVSRLSSADSARYAYWRVALTAFAKDPVTGTGAGGFAVEWRKEPGQSEVAVDAHSLYIETLSELGLVGAALLVVLFGAIARALVAVHRHDRGTAAGLAAALFTYTLHAGMDWDWELPALTGIALLLAAAAVAWEEELR